MNHVKKARIQTAKDLRALPEGQWVEVAGGTKVESHFEGIHVEDGRIIVPLPARIVTEFGRGANGGLRASIRKGELVVEKRRGAKRA